MLVNQPKVETVGGNIERLFLKLIIIRVIFQFPAIAIV